ncbi:MAG: 4Fe-4S binding protein [Dehalococcoidales bacterium]|nr:4Fe-4S binding protein [Dehalococcoidales bacterium]MDD5401817.1 4Fe-4S binding protein [Dehalococcoidales bacterium]
MQLLLTVILISIIGMVCGAAIYIVYIRVPHKVPGLRKIDEINSLLPGMNCGACGYAGCFALASELVNNPEKAGGISCPIISGDKEAIRQLEAALGVSIDAEALNRKAMMHCGGVSDVIFDYSGAETCKAAALLAGGFKRCPYACLGLGDCMRACKYGAISIDKNRGVAVIDYAKCIGCSLCIRECPQNLIQMVPGKTKIAFRCNYAELKPISGRERCKTGCIHCRKCFNACKYEAITWNKEKAIPEFNADKCTFCGDCIEACPTNTLEFFRPKE